MKIELFDGAMGTLLMRGYSEEDALDAYIEAGCDILTANTVGGTDITVHVALARRIAAGRVRVALDIGPLGDMLEPVGELSYDDAEAEFAAMFSEGAAAGADLILIETMTDLRMAKLAVAAAKLTTLPVYVTMSFGGSGFTLFGDTPERCARELSDMGVAALGANCSLGPRELLPIVAELLKYSTVPVIIQPNAGLPVYRDGETVYPVEPEEFARYASEFMRMGVSIIGGCCGTTPDHIRMMRVAISEHIKGSGSLQ